MNETQKQEGLEPWQEDILEEYLKNESTKLKRLVRKLLLPIGGIEQKDEDDFISKSTDVLWKLLYKYDKSIEVPFHNYFESCLKRRFITWGIRDVNRQKNKNMIKKKDKDGNDTIDEKGNPVYEIIPDISLNAPIGENETPLSDVIEDKSRYEDETSEKVERYLNSLSDIQRKIIEMKINGYASDEIQEKLGISGSKILSELENAKKNRNILLFNRNRTTYKKTEEDKMQEMVMEIDTTDSYRMDKNTLDSLLDDKMNGDINCNYVSQRLPFQWPEEKVNKFYSRLLNNQPITEIIICEVNEDGEKVCYLIDGLQRLSYAEAFKQDRIVCKKNGAEFWLIKYKDYEVDSDGNRVFENGRPVYTYKEFDIIGKKYSELPEFLQKRFDKFNVNVTRYFNCTPQMVDYHLRNYNNYEGMSKSQYAITSISNETVEEIKKISLEHPFFKNNTKTTAKNETKGALEEVVARTVITLNFVDDWKKDLMDTLKFVDENTSEKDFTKLRTLLDRFANVATNEIKELLTTANIPVWVKVFDMFTIFGKKDVDFIEFMKEFDNARKDAKSSEYNGILNETDYDTYIARNTRDKSNIKGKIEMITRLMTEYFHIDIEMEPEESSVIDFTYAGATEKVSEDIEFYNDILDDLLLNVDNDTKLLEEQNRSSLLTIVAYGCQKDIDLDDWVTDYFSRTSNYIKDSEQNYIKMAHDLNNYILKKESVAA